MKIRLIYPRFKKFLEDHPFLSLKLDKYIVGNYTMPPSLALPIIASLTPDEFEVVLTDDNAFEKIDYNEKIDLVAISCFTPQAERAYEIATEYRKRGTKVIIGGMHPSSIPDEAQKYADAVAVGEAELVWQSVLKDLKNGTLKKRYTSNEKYSLADLPIPKREIFSRLKYRWNAHLVLTMRGCPVKCAACPIPIKEHSIFRFRPLDNIIDDISSMPYREFYFIDDMIMLPGKRNRKFLYKLLERTATLDISIFIPSTMRMMDLDYHLYKSMATGNVSSIYTVFGFDETSINLFSNTCTKSEWQRNIDIVRMIEDNGIHFYASFGIGFDHHDKASLERMLDFSRKANIDLGEFFIATPFPGTPFGSECEKNNRILHRNYSKWNQAHVVFKPKNFTSEELMNEYFSLWERFYMNIDHNKTIRSFDLNNEWVGKKQVPTR